MARQAPLPIVLFASALVACGGSSSSPIVPDGYAPEPAAVIELGLTEDRIAATEIGAVGLAFDLEEGQRQAMGPAWRVARAGRRAIRP